MAEAELRPADEAGAWAETALSDDFADTQPLQAEPQTLDIGFTGSGSEYFRIWIVNLLLTLLTVGIYYPWAKVRRLRYFHGNTLVAGAPLGYHADPKKMLKGYLLVGVMFALYSAAGHFSPIAGLIAFVIVMLIWPARLKSSMQFRLANTSWRGLRLRFMGSLPDAYKAMLPLFVPALILVAVAAFIPQPATAPTQPPAALPTWFATLMIGYAVVVLGTLAVTPWLFKRLKAYQHQNYAIASQSTHFEATTGMFYKLYAKLLGVSILGVGLLGIVAAVAIPLMGAMQGKATDAASQMKMAFMGAMFAMAYLLTVFVLIKPYLTTRMQNLVWSHTATGGLQFHSSLKFRSMLWLSLKNWLLVFFTLGLYWPFAAVARARLQLQAVSIETTINLDELVSHARDNDGEAAGDAAGDLFGLDVGF